MPVAALVAVRMVLMSRAVPAHWRRVGCAARRSRGPLLLPL